LPEKFSVDELLARQRADLVVSEHRVVDLQPLDELLVAGCGEADQVGSLALGEEEGGDQRRLARCGGERHGVGTEELLVVDLVVNQERRVEQRPEEDLLVLAIGVVDRIGVGAPVALVGGGQRRPVRRGVDETVIVDAVGDDEQVVRGRQ